VVLATDDQERHPPRIHPCQCCALTITPATIPTADQARAGGLPFRKEHPVTVPPDAYDYNQGSGTEPTRSIDAGRLWTGGVATALVAALVAVVGVLIARGLFDVPVLAPSSEGSLGNASTFRLAGLAAGAALLATGLLHLLLVSTPRPRQFFTWIVALATIAAALAPFLTDADLAEKVATSAIYVAIGVAIGSLLSGVARSAMRRRR